LADNTPANLYKRNTIKFSDNQKVKNDSFSLNDYELEKVIAIDDVQPQNNSPSNAQKAQDKRGYYATNEFNSQMDSKKDD